jgi:lipoate-protein ligase A
MKTTHIFLFPYRDPLENLVLEEQIFLNADPTRIYFYSYINSPSLVIGKNQNPWKEVDLAYIQEKQIPFFRRITGGGTVYHDEGNINFGLIMDRNSFNKDLLLSAIERGVEQFGISLERGPRADLFYQNRKCSGSAYTMKGNLALHHATLLIDSDLASLNSALKGVVLRKGEEIQAKGIDSAKSPVISLRSHLRIKAEMHTIQDTILHSFTQKKTVTDYSLPDLDKKLLQERQDLKWKLGRTPGFTFKTTKGKLIEVKEGKAVSSDPSATGWFNPEDFRLSSSKIYGE